MDEYPVKLGPILVTMVDPNPGHEVAYNRWYERDHFYAGCMIGPWLFAGSRWVAPRRLKDLRFPAESPFAEPVDAGSYLSIYWELEGKGPEHGAWAGPQVWWLYGNNRGFQERTHRHTSLYDFSAVSYSDDDGVPIELALDHRYEGLGVVSIEPAEGHSTAELGDWLASNALPSLLATDGVDSVASFTPQPMPKPDPDGPRSPMSLGTDGGSPDRIVQLCFLEKEPTAVWDAFRAYGQTVDAGGVGRVTFAAPFLPTDVGTDRYTDELW
jgi:hypothetical protein